MNAATMKLQVKSVNLVQCRTVIRSFISKKELYTQTFGRRTLSHFPRLAKVSQGLAISDEEPHVFVDRLKAVKEDTKTRFKDLIELEIPGWVVKPLSQCDSEVQDLFSACRCAKPWRSSWHYSRSTCGWNTLSVFLNFERRWRFCSWPFQRRALLNQGISQVFDVHNNYRNRLDLNASGGNAFRLKLTHLIPAFKPLPQITRFQVSTKSPISCKSSISNKISFRHPL